MKALKELLFGVSLVSLNGDREQQIEGLAFDSRKVQKGCLFIAIKGLQVDGHDFIEKSIELGAVSIVCEQLPEQMKDGISYVQVADSSVALSLIAGNFYDHPSEKLNLVGITGTNGKTTTATLLFQLFTRMGYKTGLLSTVENRIGEKVYKAMYTTPDGLALNEMLAEMVAAGCTHCFMEVSSHALVQQRVAGIRFSGAVFTNITHDHLDYHQTFDAYIAAKKLLFDGLDKEAFALVNIDDKRGRVMVQNCKADVHSYALKTLADFKARTIHNTLQGLELDINGVNAWFRLIGDFNAYNLLCVYGVAMLLGEQSEDVLTTMSELRGANGRFELVHNGQHVLAIVDYAHTPDALENVLKTIDALRTHQEQLITVVGCGGDRDTTKRPIMARLAAEYSNKILLTSDNPRTEDPAAILEDMLKGVPKVSQKRTMVIQDRKEAIRTACNFAQANDIILVAGKGHETYQEIMGVRHHFDDKEVLNQMLNNE